MTATAFPERLRQLRTSRGLSQPQLADATKLGQSSISRWELGEAEPILSGIRRLAEFFDVSADYLCGISPDPKPLTPGRFLVDLAAVERIKAGKKLSKGETWYCVIPERHLLCTPQQYAELDRALPERWRRKSE